MEFLSKFGRPLGAAAGLILSGAVLVGCAAEAYSPEAGYPPPGAAGGPPPQAGPSGPPPEYAQNMGPQGGGYYNPPSEGYGPPPGGGGYGPPSAEGYGPPPGGAYGPPDGGGYGPPSTEGYGPPPGGGYGPRGGSEGYGPPPGGGYGPPAAEGYGPPRGGGYGGPGITRERFIARARHRAIVHGRDPELAARHAARRFNRIDVDHNGVIERGEMQAWRASHAPHRRAQGAPPPGYDGPSSPYPPPSGSSYQQY